MRSDIVPGGIFPDYELPDHTNTMRRLSELQGDDPLILTLACHRAHAPRPAHRAARSRRVSLSAVFDGFRLPWLLSAVGWPEGGARG